MATVAIAAATALLAGLGIAYAGTGDAGRLDGTLTDVVDRLPAGRGGLAWEVVRLGDPLPVVLISAALAGACLLTGRRRAALVAVLGPGITGLATTLLKPVFNRTIDNAGFAYPSGHTGAATALGLVSALILVSLIRARPPLAVPLLVAGAAVPGVGMAMALVVLTIHYPTDTVGGFCAAVVAVLGAARIVDTAAERGRPEGPPHA